MRNLVTCFILGACCLLVQSSIAGVQKSDNEIHYSDEQGNSEEPQHVLPFIFPGTKWCGNGDLAKSYDDLGIHKDTDICCRAHDVCNDTMEPGETKNNLTNTSPFTRLACKCDLDFYDCLEKVNSMTSNTLGKMYFNVLKGDCYAEDYPLTKKCKKYKTFLKLICVEYYRDETKPKVFQWFPAKRYKKLPLPIVGGIGGPAVGNN